MFLLWFGAQINKCNVFITLHLLHVFITLYIYYTSIHKYIYFNNSDISGYIIGCYNKPDSSFLLNLLAMARSLGFGTVCWIWLYL